MSYDKQPGESFSEDGERAEKRLVPVVPGGFDPVISNRFIGPLPWPPYEVSEPEPSRARMWAVTGAIVLVSATTAGWALYQPVSAEPTPPPAASCKTTGVSEAPDGTVSVRLARSAGNEKVWVGNDLGVMQAQQTAASPDVYSFNANGYLHEEVIGVYVGGVMCAGRFNLGSVLPGDEVFYAAG